VSKINITELELLNFAMGLASGESGFENRATPLAAGGGTHEVGGVVFKTASPEAESTNSASSRINVTDNSALGLPRAEIRMACSKGTYVRAFARDLGEALGSGAHLDSLQRSRSGLFRVENALSVEEAIQKLQ
jgi:tRNA U55 pseudouridine synthase TruB